MALEGGNRECKAPRAWAGRLSSSYLDVFLVILLSATSVTGWPASAGAASSTLLLDSTAYI